MSFMSIALLCIRLTTTDYTDFHKISVLILCNLVVLYADIHTILSEYVKSQLLVT